MRHGGCRCWTRSPVRQEGPSERSGELGATSLWQARLQQRNQGKDVAVSKGDPLSPQRIKGVILIGIFNIL